MYRCRGGKEGRGVSDSSDDESNPKRMMRYRRASCGRRRGERRAREGIGIRIELRVSKEVINSRIGSQVAVTAPSPVCPSSSSLVSVAQSTTAHVSLLPYYREHLPYYWSQPTQLAPHLEDHSTRQTTTYALAQQR